MRNKNNTEWLRQLAGGGFFIVLGIAIVAGFLAKFAPSPYVLAEKIDELYDRQPMQDAVCPEAVLTALRQVEAFGSRAVGQAGHDACADYIESRFRAAGLEILTQELDTVRPLAEHVAVHSAAGELKFGIYPALPNHVQPMVTPAGGLSGKLVLVNEALLAVASDFAGMIALVDLAQPLTRTLGMNPERFAELGFEAMIVSHSEGIELINWPSIRTLSMHIPYNYIRLVAESAIFAQVGQELRLDVRTSFANLANRNLVGVLRAGRPTGRALVVVSQYDGFTALPDLNHSSIQALQVATQLQLLKGLLGYRQRLRRDVIFVACGSDYMAQNSLMELVSAVESSGETLVRKSKLEADHSSNAVLLRHAEAAKALFADARFAADAATTTQALATLPAAARDFFNVQYRYVLKERVFELNEKLLNAQVEFERQPDDLQGEPFRRFRQAKMAYDHMNSVSSFAIGKFIETEGNLLELRRELQRRLSTLVEFHATRQRRLEQSLAINSLFSEYEELLVISSVLAPAAADAAEETISFSAGHGIPHAEAAAAFRRVMQEAVFSLGLLNEVKIDFRGLNHGDQIQRVLGGMPLQSRYWSMLSYPAFAMLNPARNYIDYGRPLPDPAIDQLQRLRHSLAVLGESVLAIGYGSGVFQPTRRHSLQSVRGRVFASGVGSSIVPDFAMPGALICAKYPEGLAHSGYYQRALFFTDVYGRYEKDYMLADFNVWSYSPEAAFYNSEGLISYYKDAGATAQNIYRSVELRNDGSPVNLVLYRGNPVAILNRINPQTMREFTGAAFLRTTGLVPFASSSMFVTANGILDFINPRERFYVALRAGSVENELVSVTRAFCLGVENTDFIARADREIDGPGYLAFDTPVLRNIAIEAAASMALVNERRIAMQKPYGMIDEMTLAFHDQGSDYLNWSRDAAAPLVERRRNANQALTYAILNHPVIRNSISEAIWGILWYMGLLVPFVFFFEKLVFGFTDMRKQLVAQGGIFLMVFTLLRILHPAFQMIRSSAMILLGFIIILISGGITILLSSKFRENLEALQKMKGQVKGAQVNKMGIMITAFMLGLNNMHRRKVRTGLTCATLVLMTFVMISFTSVQSNIVDQTTALARAPYQGILVKLEDFQAVSAAEIAALNERYGAQFSINERTAILPVTTWSTGEIVDLGIEVAYGQGNESTATAVKTVLELRQGEPLQSRIEFVAGGWFEPAQTDLTEGPYPILLSDRVADSLQIRPEAVAEQKAMITINGVEFSVQGIFVSQAFERIWDFDADNLLPFDGTALTNPRRVGVNILADKDDPRVSAGDALIALTGKFPAQHAGERRTLSVAIDMSRAPFRIARTAIDTYLEQSGRATFYGLDGMSYRGRRARETTMAGIADMLIPLVIAALTVLNTMKGSVYERRDEIYVYNAVGIAPRYIFFMFIAEAMVYAVVGALLGYILSQGTGRVLTILGWTGGINMNFTSLSTVYASLTIGVAALLSTYFPARSAMDIAKPADDAGWSLPEAEADSLSFELPFTFTHYDRIAVLGFFHRYFENHGEGSSGPFFAGKPQLGVAARRDPLADEACIPMIKVCVWLKPFDLGVSQEIEIDLATDAETGEFIARMTLKCMTGSKESWIRLNETFVRHIRRHFLHWRAVSDEMKQDLYGKAKGLFEQVNV